MKFLYTLSFLIFSLNSIAQTTEEKPVDATTEKATTFNQEEYEMELTKLRHLYAKMINSESYIKQLETGKEFMIKTNMSMEEMEYFFFPKKETEILDWIKNNLEKTDFQSYETAEIQLKYFIDSDKKIALENKEFLELQSVFIEKYGKEKMLKIYLDSLYD